MTDEQILKIAKTCAIFETDSYCWECGEDELLKFAKAMYEEGRQDESELYVDKNY